MKKYNLIVTAHPDDETIFAGGLLQLYRRRPWKVICVTDGNADGAGEARKKDFENACARLKVDSYEVLGFPDIFEKRLQIAELIECLGKEEPSEVFTHGPLGEYGHPHHQDVCLAVHRRFAKAKTTPWSFAYNSFAKKIVRLTRKAFDRKCTVLSEIYFSETKNFARLLPATYVEGFHQVTLKEIEALYAYLSEGGELEAKKLDTYRWFEPYLSHFREDIRSRRF